MWYRCALIVQCEKWSCSPISRLECPEAAIRAICNSWGVSSSIARRSCGRPVTPGRAQLAARPLGVTLDIADARGVKVERRAKYRFVVPYCSVDKTTIGFGFLVGAVGLILPDQALFGPFAE